MLGRPTLSVKCPLATSPCFYFSSTRRVAASPAALHLSHSTQSCRLFSSSRHGKAKSHYETLGVEPAISKSDLKKRFYILSKETHPDINKSDPNASARFSEISEAYTVLGNDEKRQKYDRDHMPKFQRSSAQSGNMRSGSHFGSRPATGLSKRRGTFKGPPPSFYATGAARNSDEQASRDQEAYQAGLGGQFNASQFASPGQWDPIFNPDPVLRTQTVEDAKRNQRRAAEMAAAQVAAEEEGDFWVRFVVISGIVAFGVGVGTMVNRMGTPHRGGIANSDGTRRKPPVAS